LHLYLTLDIPWNENGSYDEASWSGDALAGQSIVFTGLSFPSAASG